MLHNRDDATQDRWRQDRQVDEHRNRPPVPTARLERVLRNDHRPRHEGEIAPVVDGLNPAYPRIRLEPQDNDDDRGKSAGELDDRRRREVCQPIQAEHPATDRRRDVDAPQARCDRGYHAATPRMRRCELMPTARPNSPRRALDGNAMR